MRERATWDLTGEDSGTSRGCRGGVCRAEPGGRQGWSGTGGREAPRDGGGGVAGPGRVGLGGHGQESGFWS